MLSSVRGFMCALAVASLLVASGAAAAAGVTGTVTTEGVGVAGATILLGDIQVQTDTDGHFAVDGLTAGAQTMIVFKNGFRTATLVVTVPASGSVSQDVALEPDLLYSDTIVVTGTRNPLTKRESSVAITTMSSEQIEEREPRNTADLLRVIPGFYVESSGGEVGNNLWARGLPADGSYRYVALMEDGMPVFDSTELFFVNSDIFIRMDENVAEMEAVRGGNAALFGSNAPGGVVNLISRTGTNVPENDYKLTLGSDGLWRVGFNHRGPLSEDWTYSFGGFYRFDEGVRDPGFPASNGGQLKFNLTRTLDNGYFRIYGKYLNDRNTFYLPLPFKAGEDLRYVDGFPFEGTLTSPEGNHVRIPLPNQEGTLDIPLEDGQHQNGYSIMAELSAELGNGWNLLNKARYMSMDHTWNALVPNDVVSTEEELARLVPDLEGTYGPGATVSLSYTNSSQAFSAGNDLLLEAGLWHVEKPMENFSDQLQLSKKYTWGSTTHELSFGTYLATYSAGNVWYFNDILTDVRSQPRFVDVTVTDAQGTQTHITDNGFRRYGSLFVRADGDVDLYAIFAGDSIKLNDKLRLDIGARYEKDRFRDFVEETTNFDLGNSSTLADDAVGGGTGRIIGREQSFNQVAFSAGLNYLVNDGLAVWGRASTGYKMPILDNYLFGDPPLEAEDLLQIEAGVRFGTPTFGLNSTAYYLQLQNFPSQDVRIVDGETVFVTDYVGEAETIGLETELVSQPIEGLRFSLSATLQRPEYTNFIEAEQDFSGNNVRRIAKEILDLSIQYTLGKARVGGTWTYYGDRWSNNANTIKLPAYDLTSFTGSYRLTPKMAINAAILNAFNSKGLTEGNPRMDESSVGAGPAFLARPVLPRRFTLSLAFSL